MAKDFSIRYQDMTNLVPSQLRNSTNVTIIDNLFNRFLTKDEAIPLYGFVGLPPAAGITSSTLPRIKQLSLDRAVNTLIPAFTFKVGADEFTFTPQDVIRRVQVLGGPNNQATWLYSQSNNYAPPINLDKFVNFYNYYWVGDAIASSPNLPWNQSIDPEYYTIAVPLPSDLDKLNVKVATTSPIVLTGSGFFDQTWVLSFTGSSTFTISATGPLVGFLAGQQVQSYVLSDLPTTSVGSIWPTVNDDIEFKAGSPLKTLLSLTIRREPIYNAEGEFQQYETFANGDSFTITAPFISKLHTQTFSGSVGIKGKIFSITSLNEYQSISGIQLGEGDRVLVKNNPSSDNGIYVVKPGAWERAADFNLDTRSAGARVWVSEGANAGTLFVSDVDGTGFQWIVSAVGTTSNTNDWQQSNFWVRRDQLTELNLDINSVTQATRPIIEYETGIELNSHFDEFGPSNSGTYYYQHKTQFNQIPLFNVYRYDGTHANIVSSIFFYVEDASSEIDPQLQKRVKFASDLSNDFVFDDGLHDKNGTTLFYKKNNALKSIWKAGYSTPTLVDQVFDGTGNGTLTVDISGVSPFISQQIWTLTAISATQFKVVGSKNKVINSPYDIVTVGVQYQYLLFKAFITAGSVPFEIGDTFTFRVGNLQTARYARVLEDGSLCDVCGGFENDVNVIGAWQVPPMFYTNIAGSPGNEIPEGTINSHIRSILANQPNGSIENRAFGGNIQLWSEPINLLTSLMMQRDMTPISLVDLAEKQYANAVTSLITIYQKNVLNYLTTNGVIDTNAKLNSFVEYLLNVRALDYDVKTVLYDSTSPVIGFPATLPQMGVVPLYSPGVVVDNELDIVALRRHDGSLYPLYVNNNDFLDLFIPPGTVVPQDLASLLNDVILQIELKFFNGISSQQRSYFSNADIENGLQGPLASYMHQELATWASQNGYDPIAGDYQAANPFTWNYAQLSPAASAGVSGSFVPARWFDFLKNHQSTISGVIPTSRPDLEPWKLMGLSEDPGSSWNVYRSQVTNSTLSLGYINAGEIRAVLKSATPLNTSLLGLPQVDGIQTNSGDTILLVSEFLSQNNGLWVVSAGNWVRSNIPLQGTTVVTVSDGQVLRGTIWYLTADVSNVNVDPVLFACVRNWTTAMWDFIATNRPGLALSVNPESDALLPPYISASSMLANYSLTNVIPSGVANSYSFGQSSPVETAWKKTAEYRYSLARALFRKDPLGWLSHLWGFEWVTIDGISYNAPSISMPATAKLPLHGETASSVVRKNPVQLTSATGPETSLIAIRDAFTAEGKQGWTIKTASNIVLGTVIEGLTYASISSNGFTLTGFRIEDEGVPFSIGDVITLNVSGVSSSYTFTSIGRSVILGFGQMFAHALRNSAIDEISSYALKAYRSWIPNLCYRAGGLVVADDLRVSSDTGVIPETAFKLKLKQSRYVKDTWLQALRVTVVSYGRSIANANGFYPSDDASDWTFRVEGYNDRYLGIKYHVLDTTGDFITFNVLDQAATKLPWKQFTKVLSEQETQLPITITGLQNLITFVSGYESKLLSDGWRFSDPLSSSIDPETGRTRSWGLEIEKLIDRVYRGIQKDQGAVINPFLDTVWFEHEAGILTEIYDTALFDIYGDPAVFDIFGAKVKSSEVTVLRQRERSKISTTVPIFSLHAQLDEIEHIFVFEKYAEPSTNENLLYDPFSGARIVSLKLNGRIQGNGTLRPEIGGYFLDENHSLVKNIQSSIDGVATLYDANKAFEDSNTSKHALALLGFSLKDYMSDLDLTDKTQFNFWRGLVHMKGTNESIDAFLNNGRFQETSLDEFWAYKVAEYGDSRSKIFPELKLDVSDTIQQFTKLQFDSSEPIVDFSQISSLDEDRWFNLEDLTVNTQFDAIQNGKFELFRGINIADCSWWNVNAPLPTGWSIYGSSPESQLISTETYYGETDALWKAEAGAGGSSVGSADGGWDYGSFTADIDRNKAYRFMLPVKRTSVQDGILKFGVFGVSDLNQPNEAVDPNFAEISQLDVGIWYMAVGYVYPLGSTGNTDDTAGVYRISNQEKVSLGKNFTWHDILEISHHARLVSTVVGTTFVLGKLMVHAIDGFEPSIDELFAGTRNIVNLDFISNVIDIDGDARKLNDTTIQFTTPAPERTIVSGFAPDNKKFSPIKLINYVDDEVVEDIPAWHPAAGIHTPSAMESINIISSTDPARYNVSTLIIGNNNYDPLRIWGSKEVGRIWLDTTRLKYVPYYDATIFTGIEERINRWGTLADYGSIDVVEWVESKVPPLEYETQAAIDAGDADVISNTKADGVVYGAQAFYRDRQWQISPIAWSNAGRPIEAAHIGGMIGSRGSFAADYDAGLFFMTANGNGIVVLDDGTFDSRGITEGMHFGEFEDTSSHLRALSENVITGFSKVIVQGSGDAYTVLSSGEILETVFGELNGVGANIFAVAEANTEVVGEIVLSSRADTTPLFDFEGTLSGQQIVKTYLTASIPGTSFYSEALVTESIGVTGESSYEINTAAVLSGLQNAANEDPEAFELFVNTTIEGRSLGDIDNSGLVDSIDVSLYESWINGTIENESVTAYIDQVFHAFILANIGLYESYVDLVEFDATLLMIQPGQVFDISLPELGMSISFATINAEQIQVPAITIAQLVVNELSINRQINVFDAAQYEVIVSSSYQFAYLTNDFTDPAAQVDPNGQGGIGWRAWTVPSQALLSTDSRFPNSSWYPMVGPAVSIDIDISAIQNIADNGGTFILNNGDIVSRYSHQWNNWEIFRDEYIDAVQTVTGPLDVQLPSNANISNISVYVNGSVALTGTYSLNNEILTIGNVISGHAVTVIIRAYSPTADDLEFDPAVEDDPLIQRQFKIDYPHVAIPIRDSIGTVVTMKYFFWVKNRSTISAKKKSSVKAIEQHLRSGPSQYLLFQNTQVSNTGYYFDSLIISGLSYLVSKDDTFKLRFTRDYTLRDDPEGLNLKDTHTEWKLIRQNQRTKIPEKLWLKVIDTACGSDIAGNILPSSRRAAYDERNSASTRFGFGPEQILAEPEIVKSTIVYTILNTKLTESSNGVEYPDYMSFLDFSEMDTWFSTTDSTRSLLTLIWNKAKVSQINELFFAVLEDIAAANYGLTDIFKTSRLSVQSTRNIETVAYTPTYD